MSSPDSFCSVILWAGSLSPNLLYHFRFGQTWEWNQDSVDPPGKLLCPLTRSCFLLLLIGRLFLLALPHLLRTCLSSLWSSPFPRHALALILFSCQGAALTHVDSLPPHNLVLWTNSSVPFPFGKGKSGVLTNCSLYGTEVTLSFSAGPVSSSFSAETYTILQAFCWSRQHQQICHFFLFLSDSRSVLATLSSPPSFLLPQSLWQKLPSLSPVLSGYNGSPDTRFSQGTMRLMSWLIMPCANPL